MEKYKYTNREKLAQLYFKPLNNSPYTIKYKVRITYYNGIKFKFVPYKVFIGSNACLTALAITDNEENIKPINKPLKVLGDDYGK